MAATTRSDADVSLKINREPFFLCFLFFRDSIFFFLSFSCIRRVSSWEKHCEGEKESIQGRSLRECALVSRIDFEIRFPRIFACVLRASSIFANSLYVDCHRQITGTLAVGERETEKQRKCFN